MKMNVFIPALYPYRLKYLGILLLIFSLLYLIAIQTSLIEIYRDIQWLKWGMMLALTIIAFSKEKNENERTRNIRIIAQHYAFQFMISLTIAYYLVIFIFFLPTSLTPMDLVLMGLVLNTIFFYTIKWLGKEDIHLNYKSLLQILKEDKLLILIWSILTFITIWLILIV
jgi:cobalamin synthase